MFAALGSMLVSGAVAAGDERIPSAWASGAAPVLGRPGDHDRLIEGARDFRYVLLGEATHGTADFYRERGRITERLIRESGVGAVAIEADVPEAERIDAYVRGLGPDRSAAEALKGFARFPRWMWRNTEFRDFAEALRRDNMARLPERRVGIYGIDLYDLFGALDRLSRYARDHAPALATPVRDAARCFAPYRRDAEAYGVATRRPGRSCARPAAALLAAVRALAPSAPLQEERERFTALRNATALVDGEAYAHATYAGAYSWNVRERSMADAVRAIAARLRASGGEDKVVVWAHNSHVGSARATDLARRGEVSVADLLREEATEQVFAVGMLTRGGTVIAAPAWGQAGRIYRFGPAPRAAAEAVLGRAGLARAFASLGRSTPPALADERPQWTIGAVFDPALGAASIEAKLAAPFDAVIFLDETTAVRPLP